jgi:zinc/manganese transport system ATP-binding protein
MRAFAQPAPHAATIEVHDLTVAYDRDPAVHHLGGHFEAGSLTAVVGPNGAGKTTLLKTIVGLLQPSEGRVSLGRLTPREVAYLPQQVDIDRQFPITVLDAAAIGLWAQVGVLRPMTRLMRGRVDEALGIVGLDGFGSKLIGTLSAGQLQRALFARLVLQDAQVILLDEPFAAIDTRTSTDLLHLVQRWHLEGRTVIAVLHDLDLIHSHFPNSLLIARQPIAWGATHQVLTADNLTRARRLSEAWAQHGDRDSRPTKWRWRNG